MPATVESVTELPIHGGQTGIEAADHRDVLYYVVTISAPDANARSIVLADPAIPADGAVLSGTGRVAVRRRAEPETGEGENDGTIWRVEVEYGHAPATFGGTGTGEPWDAEVKIGFGVVVYDRVLEKDFTTPAALPVVNSAGDPFDPPIMFRQLNGLLRVRWSKRRSEFDPPDAQALLGSLNQSAFSLRGHVYAAEKAMLLNVDAEDAVWSDGTTYYNIYAEIETERDVLLKNPKRLNRGYREKRTIASVVTRVYCTDPVYDPDTSAKLLGSDGKEVRVPVSAPVFLYSADGTRYPATATTPETDCVKQFVEHPTSSWANLSLP